MARRAARSTSSSASVTIVELEPKPGPGLRPPEQQPLPPPLPPQPPPLQLHESIFLISATTLFSPHPCIGNTKPEYSQSCSCFLSATFTLCTISSSNPNHIIFQFSDIVQPMRALFLSYEVTNLKNIYILPLKIFHGGEKRSLITQLFLP